MFWRKKRSFDDFQHEIDSHLKIEADEIREAGACDDPEGTARREFGNVSATQERWYEHSRWMFFDHLRSDSRLALRQLQTRPGFCMVVILTLALGIGATSAIFSVVEAVLLRPLPYKDPGRLAMLFSGDPARELHEGRVSLLNFADWKSQNRSFEDMTVFNGQTFLLGDRWSARTNAFGPRAGELLAAAGRGTVARPRLYSRRRAARRTCGRAEFRTLAGSVRRGEGSLGIAPADGRPELCRGRRDAAEFSFSVS